MFFYMTWEKIMFRPYTLQEIADELGLSRERVRQIERQALAKVRASLIKLGYDAEDLRG